MSTLEKEPSPRVLRVFEATEREAERYGHEYIGTEHLLLGLLAEPDGIAGRVLIGLGVTDDAAARVREIIASEGYNTAVASRHLTVRPVGCICAAIACRERCAGRPRGALLGATTSALR